MTRSSPCNGSRRQCGSSASSFPQPRDTETLDFKFLLKLKYGSGPCVVEEGPDRLLTGGMLAGGVVAAVFRLPGQEEALQFRVLVKADGVLELHHTWKRC